MLDRLRNVVYALTGPRPAGKIDVTEITTQDQLDVALAGTDRRPVFLFKHSTTCPISYGAHRRVMDFIHKATESGATLPAFYLIKVIESRPISNAIADKFGVPHKSPQLLLIDHGSCRWDTSHYDITGDNIEKALQAHVA